MRPILATIAAACCTTCAPFRDEVPLASGASRDAGVQRLLDSPDRVTIRSPWDPEAIAAEPERGLTPRLDVDLASTLPSGAVTLPGGEICFALPVLPETPCLVEFADGRTVRRDLVVLELPRAPSDRVRFEALITRVADRELFVLATHAEGAEKSAAPTRLEFRTTARTRVLLLALVGGTNGEKEPGRLRAWELPLARHLALELPAATRASPGPGRFIRKLALCGDLRRTLVAPAGTRVEIELDPPATRFRLSFSYGVLEERRAGAASTPMRFRAWLERDRTPPEELLQTTLVAGATPASQLWQEFSHEMAGDGRPARLVLESASIEAGGAAESGELVALFAEPKVEPLDAAESLPPNVLLISLDTLRADRLGCYGYARPDGLATSPAIDAFARQCLRFANARSPAPWTLPAHATMFTGLAPPVHRVTRSGRRLTPGVHPLLATEFAGAGYATAAFTAGGFVAPDHGFDAGFDRYSILDPFATDANLDRDLSPRAGDRAFNDAVRAHYSGAAIERWIEAQTGRPFFLFLHTYVVHDYYPPAALERSFAARDSAAPLPPGRDLRRLDLEGVRTGTPPSPELVATARDLYDATIAAADAEVGALLAWLAASGRLDRTIVALVADHGEEHGEHGGLGHGQSLYEELLRIPFLLHVPGIAPAVVAAPVDLADLAPTLREAAGLPPVLPCDGESLLARMRDGGFRDSFWAELGPGDWGRERGLRLGRFKLLLRPPALAENFARRALRPSTWELYDLEADPGEQRSLVPPSASPRDDLPPTIRALAQRFDQEQSEWRARREALVPDAAAIAQSTSEATKERLRALGYASDSTTASDDDE